MMISSTNCDGDCETCPQSCPLDESCGGCSCSDSQDIYGYEE